MKDGKIEDVIQLTLSDTYEYINKLKIRETIQTQVLRHVELIKKGIPVSLSYTSELSDEYFQYFVDRFNIDKITLEGFNLKNQVDYSTKTYEMKKRFHSKGIECEKKVRQVNMVRKHSLDLHNQLREDYLESESFKEISTFIEDIIKEERNSYRKEKEKYGMFTTMVRDIERNKKNLHSIIRDYEDQFALLVLDFYMKRLKYYLEQLFDGFQVRLSYSRKDWKEMFKEGRTVVFRKDKQESIFERQLKKTLYKKRFNFHVEVRKGDYLFRFSRAYLSLVKDIKKVVDLDYEDAKREVMYFLDKNDSFNLLLQTALKAKETISDQSLSYQVLMNVVTRLYPKTVQDYNRLIEKMHQAKEINQDKPKNDIGSQVINLENVERLFPTLDFDIKKEKNMIYAIALKKDRFEDVLYSVTGNGLSLILNEAMEES